MVHNSYMHSRVWPPILYLLAFVGSAFASPTFSRDVSRIMQAKCQQCHRPKDIAPFPLVTYDDAQQWADDIKRVISAKQMPPWKPAPGHGDFRDSYALSDDERQIILDWVNAGAPQGDPTDMPDPLPVSAGEWQLGNPDLVLQMPQYDIPRAKDTYRCFVMPTGIDENRFVSAVQALPGDKQVVHHVLLFIDTSGKSATLDGQDGQPGYTCFGGPEVPLSIGGALGGWVPGMRIRPLPEGIGIHLPGKARIIMQVHYHPSGRIGSDQTKIGLWFSKPDTVQKRLIYIPIVNDKFEIPAGAANYKVTASLPVLPFLSAKAITIAPHMHLLGRTIRMEVIGRDGKSQDLIYIDDWDFNWQGIYTFVEPVPLSVGSTVKLTATYDNSENNPKNPNNPLKAVRWGEGTEDEMCLGFLGVVFDNETLIPFRKLTAER